MLPTYSTTEEFRNIVKINNVLSITYRNAIEIDNGSFTSKPYEPYETSETSEIDPKLFFRFIEFLMNIRDLGYYIPASQSLKLLASFQTSPDYTDASRFSYNEIEIILTEIETILGSQEAKYTYKTLFGNGIFADTIRNMGGDPYVYQLMHYMHVYDGVDTPVLDTIHAHAKDVYEPKKSFITLMADCAKRSEEDILKMVLQIFPEELPDWNGQSLDNYQRLDIVSRNQHVPMDIFMELIESNNPMSNQMKSQVREFISVCLTDLGSQAIGYSMQFTVPCKETLAFLITEFIKNGYPATPLVNNINNATDVLRAFAIYSDPEYDGSLSKAPKFKNH